VTRDYPFAVADTAEQAMLLAFGFFAGAITVALAFIAH